jgi:hypothetical protein
MLLRLEVKIRGKDFELEALCTLSGDLWLEF